jgi:hypothetical protein
MRVSSTSCRDSLLHAAMVESRSGMLLELSNPPERRGHQSKTQGACCAPGRKAGPRGPATATTAFAGRGCGWQAATVEWRWRASPAEDGGRRARRVEHWKPCPGWDASQGGGGLRANPFKPSQLAEIDGKKLRRRYPEYSVGPFWRRLRGTLWE